MRRRPGAAPPFPAGRPALESPASDSTEIDTIVASSLVLYESVGISRSPDPAQRPRIARFCRPERDVAGRGPRTPAVASNLLNQSASRNGGSPAAVTRSVAHAGLHSQQSEGR